MAGSIFLMNARLRRCFMGELLSEEDSSDLPISKQAAYVD
jgi:hypothetical protein